MKTIPENYYGNNKKRMNHCLPYYSLEWNNYLIIYSEFFKAPYKRKKNILNKSRVYNLNDCIDHYIL